MNMRVDNQVAEMLFKFTLPEPVVQTAQSRARSQAPPASGPVLGGSAPKATAPTKVGRNDPCPCGSGKKYKKCHGTA